MTQIRTEMRIVDPQNPDPTALQQAGSVIREGGLVAFPTETVYGLGANALNADAVARIFNAKGRPSFNPLIVHVPDIASARELVAVWTEEAEKLAQHFWAGPLTLVLPKSHAIPDIVTGGGNTVAVRIPAHPIAQALLRSAGVPIAAPSANRSNQLSPTLAKHVVKGLNGRIDMILDGGATSGGVESTVLSLVESPPRLLRPGLITPAEISEVIGIIQVGVSSHIETERVPLLSPGMLTRHYAPQTPLLLATNEGAETVKALLGQGLKVVWLTFQSQTTCTDLQVVVMPQDAEGYASRLFAELHQWDSMGVDRIVVSALPQGEKWLAVADRLQRASQGEAR